MYRLLIIGTKKNNSVERLYEQIDYLESHSIRCKLLTDPTQYELELEILQNDYDCIYANAKECFERINGEYISMNYDIIKVLDYRKAHYIGSDYLTHLLINDKFTSNNKTGLEIYHVIISRRAFLHDKSYLKKVAGNLEYPLIVKPNSLYGSLGIDKNSIVNSQEELEIQITKLFDRFNDIHELLVEKYLPNATEYTVSVLGNGNSTVCSVAKFKYKDNNTFQLNSELDKLVKYDDRSFEMVAENDEYIYNRLMFHSKRLFEHFSMRDYARFDFLYDGIPYLMEPNSSPQIGNSFSFEWKSKYGIENKQLLALVLCTFHYRQISSGKPDRLPTSLLESFPENFIGIFKETKPIITFPDSAGPCDTCYRPELYSMIDRVSAEAEVLQFLKSLVIILKPSFILETGTYKGASSLALAEGLIYNKYGKMVTIEVDNELAFSAKKALRDYPVLVHCGSSIEYEPKEKIDLLFLDSTRTIRKQEFCRFKSYLSKDAIIVWHDSALRKDNSIVYDAINELHEDGLIDRILLPTPRGLTISKLLG